MRWDYRDMLASIDLGGGGVASYQYDASRQRTRKRIEKQNGSTGFWERIYLGGFELYRRYTGDGSVLVEEIETHHLSEGEQRVLLVDDVITASDTANPRPDGLTVGVQTLFRYQYSNHLGSACLELDEERKIISYEEFHPYGTSAYRFARSGSEVPPKRYRYSKIERDEESGLNYQGARYSLSSLGRWLSPDPSYLGGGLNLYAFGANNPVLYTDASGFAPEDYQKQRQVDTSAKAKEMERNLEDAIENDLKPDPMQKRAEKLAKKRGKTPIEQHHHTGVKETVELKAPAKSMGKSMSSVWSTKADPSVEGGIGDLPSYDPEFEEKGGEFRTHHNVAKHLDLEEQSRRPGNKKVTEGSATPKALQNAGEASKARLPATADLTERASQDWSKATDPRINEGVGKVKPFDPKNATPEKLQAVEKANASQWKKLKAGPEMNWEGPPEKLHSGGGMGKADIAQAALEIFKGKQDQMVEEILKKSYYSLNAEEKEFMDYAGYVHDYNTGAWKKDPDVDVIFMREALIVALTLKKTGRYVGDWLRSTLGISGGTPIMFSAR
jgi:RHS repeat-associated protein